MHPTVERMNPDAEFYFVEGCHIIELWNQPVDAAVSIARARVAPGTTTVWHRLRGIVERYVVLSGKGTVEIGDLGARRMGPGDVAVIPPLCPQRITNTGTEDLIFLAVCTPRFTSEAYEALR